MNLEINNKKLENVKNHGHGLKEIRKCLNMNENKNTCGQQKQWQEKIFIIKHERSQIYNLNLQLKKLGKKN